MAEDDRSSLHIDLDWKKQAQEEKRRLEEEEKKRATEREAARSAVPVGAIGGLTGGAVAGAVEGAGPVAGAAVAGARGRVAGRGARGERVLPPASIATLIQSLVTQITLYLGELSQRDEVGSMDMAKHLIDTLAVLEDKTKGNLTPDEQQFLDLALYETRMRFIGVAGQVIAGA